MSQLIRIMFKLAAAAGLLGAALPLAGCYADAGYATATDDVYAEDPPPAYVATAQPYYYGGWQVQAALSELRIYRPVTTAAAWPAA